VACDRSASRSSLPATTRITPTKLRVPLLEIAQLLDELLDRHVLVVGREVRLRHHSFQLYASDPSGNYSGWKATCIGANNSTAQSLLHGSDAYSWNE
jgi:hypothetical protein